MIRYFIILLLTLLPNLICAQMSVKPINLSLWHPVSISKFDSLSTTNFSLGFQSKNHNLSGVALNIIGSKLSGNLSGINLSGLYSHIQGDVKGLTASGLINAVIGRAKGVEFAGLLNMSLNSVQGLQFAPLSNMSIGTMRGWQISAGYNIVAQEMRGLQFSGLGNITAKGSNIIQLSGIFNISLQSMKGIQMAASNFADTIKGMQLGVINVSSMVRKGVQIGLINYSHENTGVQIGLVNISRLSKLEFLVYGGNFLYTNVAARVQNKHTYSMLGLGFPYYGTDEEFSGGVFYRYGVRLPVKRFNIRPDVGVYLLNIFDEGDYQDAPMRKYSLQGRLSLEYVLGSRLNAFVTGGWSFTSKYGETTYKGKPIFEGGVSLFLTSFIK